MSESEDVDLEEEYTKFVFGNLGLTKHSSRFMNRGPKGTGEEGDELDPKDKMLLDIIEDDWTPKKEISEESDLSSATVKRRMNDLKDKGYVRERKNGRQKEYKKL